MGKINQGILGGISGKVGPVVGGSWKGINYVRSMPTSVSNPNTVPQQNQRAKFKGAVSMGQALLGAIIQIFWNPIASGMSGFNRFLSKNVDFFSNAGILDYPNALPLSGTLLPAPILSLVADASLNTIVAGFGDNGGVGNALSTDTMVLIVYNASQGYWKSITAGYIRSSGTISLPDGQMLVNDAIHAYLCVYRTGNYGLASIPEYLPTNVIP